jgi:hypothetical protein
MRLPLQPTPTACPSPAELVLLHHPPEGGETDASTTLDVLSRALEHARVRLDEAEVAAEEAWAHQDDLREQVELWRRTSLDLHMTLLEVVHRVHPDYRDGLPDDLVINPGTPERWPLFQEVLHAMCEVFRRFDAIGWTDPAPRPYRGPRLSVFELLRAHKERREPRPDEPAADGMDVDEVS